MNELVAFFSVFFFSQVDLSGASDCSTYVKEELLSPQGGLSGEPSCDSTHPGLFTKPSSSALTPSVTALPSVSLPAAPLVGV